MEAPVDDNPCFPFANEAEILAAYAAWIDRSFRRVLVEIRLSLYPKDAGLSDDPLVDARRVNELRGQHWRLYCQDRVARAHLDARLSRTSAALLAAPVVRALPGLEAGGVLALHAELSGNLHVRMCRSGRFSHCEEVGA
jgi:hypothetical protein